MKALRTCFLIAALAGLASTVVYLRTEQTRCEVRILKLESQWIRARREWWALQTRSARLRAPERIYERVELMQSTLISPADRLKRPARLASHRP